MSVRTTPVGGTVIDASGNPRAGIVVAALLQTPIGSTPLSSVREAIDTTARTATAGADGAYLFDPAATPGTGLIAPGDIYQLSGGVLVPLPGCTWKITYLTKTIVSPSFAYSASAIDPASWVPALSALGLLKMDLTVIFGNAQADPGVSFTIASNADSFWTGGIGAGQLVSAAGGFSVQTDSAGRFHAYLIRQSELNPNTGFYIATKGGATGTLGPLTFTAPDAYTDDAGVWLVGTAYTAGQVVRYPSTDEPYICLLGNTGHAPTQLGIYWAEYPGENIEDNLHLTGAPGTAVATQTSMAADASYTTGAYAAPPATLRDQLRAMAQEAITVVTAATYAVLDADQAIVVNALANNVDITLQAVAGRTRRLDVVRIDTTTFAVTLHAQSGEHINGVATYGLPARWQSASLLPTSSGYVLI